MRVVYGALALMMVPALVAVAIAGQDPAGGGRGAQPAGAAPAGPGQRGGGAPPMVLTTTAFADGGQIPVRFTQAGEQVSPVLTWTNAPPNTMSFVLHMHDLEASRNRTTEDQLHWLVWNIPGTATGLPEGVKQAAELPDGSRQVSASGLVYRGPGAPAAGPLHHYTFELFALDIKLEVPAGGEPFETRTNVMKAIQGHILGKAVYMGLFRRPQ